MIDGAYPYAFCRCRILEEKGKKERKTGDDDMSLQDFSTSAKLLTTLAVVQHAQKIVRLTFYSNMLHTV